MEKNHQIGKVNDVREDTRPRAFDKNSRRWIMVDTGAMVTVLPKAWFPEAQLDHKTVLTAVNKSRISTYGQKAIQFRFGRKTYKFTTIIGDITTPVIGWDTIQ